MPFGNELIFWTISPRWATDQQKSKRNPPSPPPKKLNEYSFKLANIQFERARHWVVGEPLSQVIIMLKLSLIIVMIAPNISGLQTPPRLTPNSPQFLSLFRAPRLVARRAIIIDVTTIHEIKQFWRRHYSMSDSHILFSFHVCLLRATTSIVFLRMFLSLVSFFHSIFATSVCLHFSNWTCFYIWASLSLRHCFGLSTWSYFFFLLLLSLL